MSHRALSVEAREEVEIELTDRAWWRMADLGYAMHGCLVLFEDPTQDGTVVCEVGVGGPEVGIYNILGAKPAKSAEDALLAVAEAILPTKR